MQQAVRDGGASEVWIRDCVGVAKLPPSLAPQLTTPLGNRPYMDKSLLGEPFSCIVNIRMQRRRVRVLGSGEQEVVGFDAMAWPQGDDNTRFSVRWSPGDEGGDDSDAFCGPPGAM